MKKYLFLFTLLGVFTSLSAQKSESKYTIIFDVATRAYTSVPTHQIKQLNTVDKVSLRLIEETEHHNVEVVSSSEVVTTIDLLKSNKYEDSDYYFGMCLKLPK